jgi:hypothetical protein
MKREHRSSLKSAACAVAVAALCAPALARASSAPSASAPPQAPAASSAAAPAALSVRYVRAKSAGVKLFNLPDTKAEVVLTLPAEDILAVHSERAGYLEVEAPQSLEVWVFGKFVKTTSDPSLLEATETLYLRPLPSSEEKSFPLAQRLHRGERVRMLGRADEQKAFKEDWIHVYAPPGTRAWVPASDTQPLASGTDAAAAWSAAVKSSQADAASALSANAAKAAASTSSAVATDAASTAPAAAKVDALEEAQKLLNAAKASVEPDYAPARAAFQKIIDDTPKSSSAEAARVGLDKITVLEEIERLKHDAKLVDQKRHDELEKANARLRELSLKQDPLWGRFQARGWIEHVGEHYWIRWSGKNSAEIECKSGRYQLADYVGFEVGVMGVTARGPIKAVTSGTSTTPAGTSETQPPLVDVTRIEVISGRMN